MSGNLENNLGCI